MRLDDSMIRVSKMSIGARGRVVRDRPFRAYISGPTSATTITLMDARGRQRRFALYSTAFVAAQEYIARHNQTAIGDPPACQASMGCLCACHAAGMSAADPCDTSEKRARQIAGDATASPERWTRHGRTLSYDGVEAIHVERLLDDHGVAKLSPVTCDAIADHVCSVLNTIDVDALTRVWVRKD